MNIRYSLIANRMKVGARLRPQAFGTCFEFSEDGTVMASCALGAVIEGLGVDPKSQWYLDHLLPELASPIGFSCKCNEVFVPTLLAYIIHLNDDHHISREKIAKLLEKQAKVKVISSLEESVEDEDIVVVDAADNNDI